MGITADVPYLYSSICALRHMKYNIHNPLGFITYSYSINNQVINLYLCFFEDLDSQMQNVAPRAALKISKSMKKLKTL